MVTAASPATRVPSDSDDAKSIRGKNWSEEDSLKLVDAYKYAQETKEGLYCPLAFHTNSINNIAGESKQNVHERMAAKFLESSPEITDRTAFAVAARWDQMMTTFR